MTVKVNDGNRAVSLVHAAEKRQGNSVVTAHGDHARKSLAVLGLALHVGVGGRIAHENAVVSLLDLLDGPLIIISVHISGQSFMRLLYPHHLRGDRNIATIDDLSPAVERIGSKGNVVTSAKAHFA